MVRGFSLNCFFSHTKSSKERKNFHALQKPKEKITQHDLFPKKYLYQLKFLWMNSSSHAPASWKGAWFVFELRTNSMFFRVISNGGQCKENFDGIQFSTSFREMCYMTLRRFLMFSKHCLHTLNSIFVLFLLLLILSVMKKFNRENAADFCKTRKKNFFALLKEVKRKETHYEDSNLISFSFKMVSIRLL